MTTQKFRARLMLSLLCAGLLAATGAMAERPDGAGHGRNNGKGQQDERRGPPDRGDIRGRDDGPGRDQGRKDRDRHFADAQRSAVRSYYESHYRDGRCPPGLARKNNGCMPPGQARKWSVGRQLPRDVIYYSLPQPVLVQLGPPPAGHRYVRVASDILLIAIGTGMVVDAIEDLGRM